MSEPHTFTVLKGSPSGTITKATGSRTLKPTEAWVKLTHCGLCGTDVHYLHADMGLGHEGVGVVEELGAATSLLSDLKVGDRVGMGWFRKLCGHCRPCLEGIDAHCLNSESYGSANTDQGCFGTGIAWDVSALYKIPDALPSEFVGPLMCGGATVWGPLYQHGAKAGNRIGIVGMGGLGSMAIQFAKAMGMEAVVFSGTEAKKAEALELGAAEFIATKGKDKFEGVQPIDFLLITTSQQPDFGLYLPLMSPYGKIFPLTISFAPHPIPLLPLITKGVAVVGSAGAHRQSLRDMLEFAARHDVRPRIQTFAFGERGLAEALRVLDEGKMRYRGVIEIQA